MRKVAGDTGKKEDYADCEVFPASDDDEAAPALKAQDDNQTLPQDSASIEADGVGVRASTSTLNEVQCRFKFGFMKQLNVTKGFGSDFCKVASFVDWVFASRGDTGAVGCFLETMHLARNAGFSDAIPVGSVCSGWGVAEMVLAELNEKIAGYYPDLPEACDP